MSVDGQSYPPLASNKMMALQHYFGYKVFREGQEELIDKLLAGQDVLAIMPTGAGKSLCFQIPALLHYGVTLVISPLISLMKDQVNALIQAGVRGAYINSSLSPQQCRIALERARAYHYKMVYVAPERLLTEEFLSFARQTEIALVAVDEAHCVSQWGQDFRPSYLKIAQFLNLLPRRPVVGAFTATATAEVRQDMIQFLQLRKPTQIVTGFDRENLYFAVEKPKDKWQALLGHLAEAKEKSAIIYCATRKTVEEVALHLNEKGYAATRYHAGLADEERRQNQDDFLYDRKNIMVATNAFGMGIDKSNVGLVVHYNMPKNLESYYQEAGRAGRDGSEARCILLFSQGDVATNQFLIENNKENDMLDTVMQEQVRAKERERLQQMVLYCHTSGCLRHYILRYFGEKGADYCGHCSSCCEQFEQVNITAIAQIFLTAVQETGQQYGAKVLIDMLRGSKNQRLMQNGLMMQPNYGRLAKEKESVCRNVVNQLILDGYLQSTTGPFPMLRLTGKGKDFLTEPTCLLMKVAKAAPQVAASGTKKADTDLLLLLKEERKRLANQQGVPAFVIFSDATLLDMCRKAPQTGQEMLQVSGVGQTKLARYGEAFLAVLNGYYRST